MAEIDPKAPAPPEEGEPKVDVNKQEEAEEPNKKEYVE
jgi:hypothetical protein